jgi:hypothetical protein
MAEQAPRGQSNNLLLFLPEVARKPTCRKAVGIEGMCTSGRAVKGGVPSDQEVHAIMMKREVVRNLMVAAVLCLSSDTAQAKDPFMNPFKDIDMTLFGMVGGATFYDKRNFISADEKYKSSYDVQPRYVYGTGVPLTKLLGLEVAYSTGPANLRVTNISLSPRAGHVYDVNHHTASVNVVLHGPAKFFGVRPYVTAGWDYNRFAPTLAAKMFANSQGFGAVSAATLTYTDKLGMNAGVGLEHKISPRVLLRLDARDHICGSPTYGLPAQASSSAIFPVAGIAHNVEYTVGIVVHIGKK